MKSQTTPAATTDETIAAIATPPGAGGIGIIRISGPTAAAILSQLFNPKQSGAGSQTLPAPHRLIHGWIINPASRVVLDEVLAVFMPAPHSYTREDVVEIQCHGGSLVLQAILALILQQGARLARPGEFTKRAFINGRIDLTQAEAVIDLLEAKTTAGLSLAASQLQGKLFEQVAAVREQLVLLRGILEVAIDFPDDDHDILDHQTMLTNLRERVLGPVAKLLASAEQGKIYRDGISVVILGRPNVGKSSLLNTLLQEDRALVTPVPGTTRDTIEEYFQINGMPVRIIDTAGIRQHADAVEEMGIQRARAKLAAADLVLLVLDATAPPADEDLELLRNIRELNRKSRIILVMNKIDLREGSTPDTYPETAALPTIAISAKYHTGISELEKMIFSEMTSGSGPREPEMGCAPNLRHKNALEKAQTGCLRLESGLMDGLGPDLLAIEIQDCLDHLGEIVGITTTEDILDAIFERFCIGK